MKRSYLLLALLAGILVGPAAGKITKQPVEKDDRRIILIARPFGFEPDGACCGGVAGCRARTAVLGVMEDVARGNGVELRRGGGISASGRDCGGLRRRVGRAPSRASAGGGGSRTTSVGRRRVLERGTVVTAVPTTMFFP